VIGSLARTTIAQRRGAAWLALAMIAAVSPGAAAAQSDPGRTITVASKPFGESFLVAEMFAQLLEARGFTVARRPGLGSTEIAFRALRTGGIDVYPEYTGTGLLAILNEAPLPDPRLKVACPLRAR
jgi:glycine betaine/choline ABC-type transport system substrate-binding protein